MVRLWPYFLCMKSVAIILVMGSWLKWTKFLKCSPCGTGFSIRQDKTHSRDLAINPTWHDSQKNGNAISKWNAIPQLDALPKKWNAIPAWNVTPKWHATSQCNAILQWNVIGHNQCIMPTCIASAKVPGTLG